MEILLPNYAIENKIRYQTVGDDNIVFAKSKIFKNKKVLLRNTTHLILILIKGGKLVHLEEKDLRVDTNEILFLSQDNYFMSEIISDDNSFESILVFFNDEYILNFIKRFSLNIEEKSKTKLLNIKKDDYLDLFVNGLDLCFENNLDNKVDLMKLKVDELLLYLYMNKKNDLFSFFNNILASDTSRIKYILESNLDILSSVSNMCKLTRLNNKALRKEIQTLYNQNPKEWLDNKRLTKAAYLLKHSEKSISEISSETGYSSVSWFIIQFKKYYKMTPLKYKEQNL